jgi:sugar-phosphatase
LFRPGPASSSAGCRDPQELPATVHELEDEDVRPGPYTAFGGAAEVLCGLPLGSWALVTSK